MQKKIEDSKIDAQKLQQIVNVFLKKLTKVESIENKTKQEIVDALNIVYNILQAEEPGKCQNKDVEKIPKIAKTSTQDLVKEVKANPNKYPLFIRDLSSLKDC